ncbi:sigma-54-dependent transcriptional regulator [Litchfieldella rifensis]|uniref:Sigma-54-dependent transcriptional regulator n=1 Tax=Litchfieldella rifensis TaxID=762643 RepID=A0ABV7LLE1_9GAMM
MMAGGQAWLRCGADFPGDARSELLVKLDHAGIAVDLSDGVPVGPGVVLFGEPTSDLHDFLRLLRLRQDVRTIAVSARGVDVECAWALLRAGAEDVLAWDACEEPSSMLAARLLRWLEIDALLAGPEVRQRLRGHSRHLLAVLRAAVEVAKFSDTPVLITGGTGTGKELLARLIHDLDPRQPKRRFVVCDCTTIVPELSGSEFFGHERGAFTGAIHAREGAIAQAEGGTLFLDEIGELPLRLQAELLRVVQEGTYKRVGSNQWLHTNFRLICATHRDLITEREEGRFREDLYYRIAGCVLRMPALDERREDIPSLVNTFLEEAMGSAAVIPLDAAVHDYLVARHYPGNVRELRQLVMYMAHRYVPPGPITLGTLPDTEAAGALVGLGEWPDEDWERAVRMALAHGCSLAALRSAVAETAYRIVLAEEDGDTGRSARRLKVSQRAVQQYLHGHGDAMADLGNERSL